MRKQRGEKKNVKKKDYSKTASRLIRLSLLDCIRGRLRGNARAQMVYCLTAEHQKRKEKDENRRLNWTKAGNRAKCRSDVKSETESWHGLR